MLDWQAILVTLFILAAVFYVARRSLSRLRSFRAGKQRNASACEEGCGCSGTQKQAGASQPTTITKIGRVPSSRQHPTH
jgi:hypothetical protein